MTTIEATLRGPNLYVVTFQMRYDDNSVVMAEFYRGSQAECNRIARSFTQFDSIGGDDRRQVACTGVQVGPMADWEKYVLDTMAEVEHGRRT